MTLLVDDTNANVHVCVRLSVYVCVRTTGF